MKYLLYILFIANCFAQDFSITGKIESKRSQWENGRIFTYYKINNQEIRTLGGTAGRITEYVNGWQQYAVGDSGLFKITNKKTKLTKIDNNTILGPVNITDIYPREGSAGTNTKVIVYGSGFQTGVKVYFPCLTGNWIEAPVVSSYSTIIECRVPSGIVSGYLSSANSGYLKVMNQDGYGAVTNILFNVQFGTPGAKWSNPNVTYYIDRKVESGPIVSAMLTWNNVNTRFKFNYNIIDVFPAIYNMRNEIYIGETYGSAALNYLYFYGSEMYESDIVIGNTQGADLESILLHELGHTLPLLDLYGIGDEVKVMCGIMTIGNLRRNLSIYDEAGIKYLYGNTTLVKELSDNKIKYENGMLYTNTPIYIYNILGQCIEVVNNNKRLNYNTGIYFLKNEKGVIKVRIVK